MFGGLRLRLYLSYLLIILLTLALAGIAFSFLLRGYREQLAYGTLREVVRPVQVLIEANPVRSRGMLGTATLEARSANVVLWLISPEGKIIVDGSESQSYLNETVPIPADALRRPRDTYRGEFQTSDGREWIFVAAPIRRPPSRFQLEAAAVAAATPKSRLGNALGDITPYLFGAGGVGLAVSLLAGLMLSRWFSRPLEHMTRAADEVAAGDYSIKVPMEGPSETRRLAASFNQMTDAVQRSQQTLRDFLANASHELKTPLTAVSGFAQAMIDGTISDREGLVRSATVIETESRRVLHLVQEILDLYRLEAGQTKFSFGVVDIRELFSHVSEVFSLRAEDTGVTLDYQVDGELAVVGDFDRLEQVLGNLVDNAFQHTARGGRVGLMARPVLSDRVELVVEDTGEGMPREALDHIFERFFQVDGSTRRGTGLGLAISKEIVRGHGGEIRAESAVGVGTRFFITLPGATTAPRPGVATAPSTTR